MELTNDKELQGRLLEAARTVFQDQHVNVNPVPAFMCEFQQFAQICGFRPRPLKCTSGLIKVGEVGFKD